MGGLTEIIVSWIRSNNDRHERLIRIYTESDMDAGEFAEALTYSAGVNWDEVSEALIGDAE